MKLEGTVLSETSETEKDRYCMSSQKYLENKKVEFTLAGVAHWIKCRPTN